MSEKRKDLKGRILRDGEYQRQDGKYEYKYYDLKGVRRSLYSWKLVDTDALPKGKRNCESLRTMVKRINKDAADGINTYESGRLSLNHLFDNYIEGKIDLKEATRANYKCMYNSYVRNEIGVRNIGDIKYSDIKNFYLSLIRKVGLKISSVKALHTILHPVFQIAVRDNYIRSNPTDRIIAEIKRNSDSKTEKKHALTIQQQAIFVDYLSHSKYYKKYLPLFTVMLGTGCRVGEIIGLRWDDCDFNDGIININHNLIYKIQDNGKCEFHITTPKTKSGIRIIPMLNDVRQALLQERIDQMKTGFNQSIIDGYSGFVFKNRYNTVYTPNAVNHLIEKIRSDYNVQEEEFAKKERREPILLPHFTAHTLRHTFCTRFCENETNLKVIQEIMGHSDISTTMNIYNEATKEKKLESFANLEGKIKIG